MLRQTLAAGTILASALGAPFATSAKTATHPTGHPRMGIHAIPANWSKTKPGTKNVRKNIVTGTVSTINGSLVTVTGRNNSSLLIDASAATITKGMPSKATTLAVTDIKIGDRLMVVGSLSGSTVSATSIHDGGGFQGRMGQWGKR